MVLKKSITITFYTIVLWRRLFSSSALAS